MRTRPRRWALLTRRAGYFLGSDVLHRLIAAAEVDAGGVAATFGDHLHFKTAFLAAKHVADGGILWIGVTHWLCSVLSRVEKMIGGLGDKPASII